MSRAYICDRCGLILPEDDGNARTIYTVKPSLFIGGITPKGTSIDLCGACFKKFEHEYMENLTEESEDRDD